MVKEKCRFVLLIAFDFWMSFFTMTTVCSEIHRDRGMMGPSPGHIVGNHVVSARVKQHLDITSPKCLQISRNENLIRNIPSEAL